MMPETLGTLLLYFRKNACLGQKELGKLLDYNHAQISRFENDKAIPGLPFLEKFRDVIQLSAAQYEQLKQLHALAVAQNHQKSSSKNERWVAETVNTIQGADFIPDISTFYGREGELVRLTRWIKEEGCRWVGIIGLGGMGKTMLAAKLAHRLKAHYAIIWYSLRDAPPFDAFLRDVYEKLSGRRTTVEGKDRLLEECFKRIQKQPYLVVVDNIESILQSNEWAGPYLPGYEFYGTFFKRFSEGSHKSCLLMTSREKPREFAVGEGSGLYIRSLALEGLDSDAGQKILHDKGLFGHEKAQNELIQRYSGNPLALKMVAEVVSMVFSGNTRLFLSQDTFAFHEIETLFNEQISRLSALQVELLYWLMIFREPASAITLHQYLIGGASLQEVCDALQGLVCRSLVETNSNGLFLQNVLLEFLTAQHIAQTSNEIFNHSLRSLHTYPLLLIQSKQHVRAAQKRLLIQPLLEQLCKTIGSANLAARLRGLLDTARTSRSAFSSYAAGNIFNLLMGLKHDLTGCDFSGLALWEVDLRDASLPDVDFRNTHWRGALFTENFSQVITLGVSPNGSLLAIGTDRGDIQIWDAATRGLQTILIGHVGWVREVSFHPTESLLLSGGDDKTARLWDLKTGLCIQVIPGKRPDCEYGHSSRVLTVAFSPDGHQIVTGSEEFIHLWGWDGIGMTPQGILYGHTKWVTCLRFHPDGRLLLSICCDETVRIWDLETRQCLTIWHDHSSFARTGLWSPDASLVYSAGHDKTIVVKRVEDGKTLHHLEGHKTDIRSICLDPTGKILVSVGDDCLIKIWDAQSGTCLKTIEAHRAGIRSAQFLPNGYLVTGSQDCSVRFWEPPQFEEVYTLTGYSSSQSSMAIQPDGSFLACCDNSEKISLWDTHNWRYVRTLLGHGTGILHLAFSADGKYLASGGYDRQVCVWNINSHERVMEVKGYLSCFSQDGKWLITAWLENIELWDLRHRTRVHVFRESDSEVCSLAISPDSTLLVVGCEDRQIRQWNLRTLRYLGETSGHTEPIWALAFRPDGQYLATASGDYTIGIWDIANNILLHKLHGHTDQLKAVAFHPFRNQIASGGQDNRVRIWDLDHLTCIAVIDSGQDTIWSLQYDPKGEWLASGSCDGTIRIWRTGSYDSITVLRFPRPYEGLKIQGIQGLNRQQQQSLKILGAIDG